LSYPLFEHLAAFEGVVPKTYRLDYDGAWHLDLASLDAARSERARAVVVVSPNNPTGQVLSDEEWRRVLDLGLPVLSDEVFAWYPRTSGENTPERLPSALTRRKAGDPPVFVLDGLSKSVGLPQLKLAWTSFAAERAEHDQIRHRLSHLADSLLSVGTPVQVALGRLLDSGRATRAGIRARIAENREYLGHALAGSATSALGLDATHSGGFTLPLRLPNTKSEEEWVTALLEQHHVWVHPGFFYDFEREPIVVVSLLVKPELFRLGITRLCRAVDES
jgi:aspartate/methionine/tyrosine aminotransferase